MDPRDSAAISARCATREGMLETLRDTERLLQRPSARLAALREHVDQWRDIVAIDECVAEVLDSVDVDLEPAGRLVRERLAAVRVATRARAEELRRMKATRRFRR